MMLKTLYPVISLVITLALWSFSSNVHAYIGPGMGLGMAVTVFGLFIASILLLVGLIWLPIRRILRERKKDRQENNSG